MNCAFHSAQNSGNLASQDSSYAPINVNLGGGWAITGDFFVSNALPQGHHRWSQENKSPTPPTYRAHAGGGAGGQGPPIFKKKN